MIFLVKDDPEKYHQFASRERRSRDHQADGVAAVPGSRRPCREVVTLKQAMRTLRERARQLKEKRPGYGALLDFYVEVREAQAASRASLRVDPVKIEGRRRRPDRRRRLPGPERGPPRGYRSVDRPLPVPVPARRSGEPASGRTDGEDRAGARRRRLGPEELVAGGGSEQEIARAAADRGLDEQVLSFLVRSSTRPSIEAASEQLRGELDLESSRTGPLPRLRLPARPQSSERGRGNPVFPLLLVRLPVAGRPAVLLRLRQQGAGGAALFLRRGGGGPPDRPLRRLPSLHQDDRLPQPRGARPRPGRSRDPPSRCRGRPRRGTRGPSPIPGHR